MRRILLIIMTIATVYSYAQNLQVHYDMGKDRGFITTTVEMFKPDKMGNTFFFIDMNYDAGGIEGIALAYWEIARVFKTEAMPFGIQVEYNGGFGQFMANDHLNGYFINDAWLAGIDYSINAKDFSKGISFKVLYKHIRNKTNASFQLTTVWFVNFLKGKMTFRGFADFWKEDSDFNFDGISDADFIFLSEPQIWYHINDHFSFGGEVELSNNFGNMDGFNVMPTLGVKWIF